MTPERSKNCTLALLKISVIYVKTRASASPPHRHRWCLQGTWRSGAVCLCGRGAGGVLRRADAQGMCALSAPGLLHLEDGRNAADLLCKTLGELSVTTRFDLCTFHSEYATKNKYFFFLLVGSSGSWMLFSRKGRFSYLCHEQQTLNLIWRLLPKYLHDGFPRKDRLAAVLHCCTNRSGDFPPLYSSLQ